MPPERVKVVYLGVPLEEFSRTAHARGDRARRGTSSASRPTSSSSARVTRLHDSKGNSYLVDAAQKVLDQRPRTPVLRLRRGAAAPGARGAGARARPRRSLRVRRLRARRRAGRVGVRHQRVSVAVGGHAADGVRGAGDGEADRRHRRRRPGRRADRRARRADRAQARRRRAGGGAGAADRQPRGSRAACRCTRASTGQQYDIAAFVRKMERLYDLLHRVSRATRRQGVLQADLSFLTAGARA